MKKEEELKKKILQKKLKQENNCIEKYLYKSKNMNNIIIENQIESIKNKINKNSFTNCKSIELSNSFRSQLFLYISNPYEQLINTRLYGKLIDDEDFLKKLHKDEIIQI